MNKKTAVFVGLGLFALVLGIALGGKDGAVQEAAAPAATATPEPSIEREDLAEEIGSVLPFAADVSAYEREGQIFITLRIPGDDYTNFGNKVIDGVRALDELALGENVQVEFFLGEVTFTRHMESTDYYGTYINLRSGSAEAYPIASEADIAQYFPASAYYLQILSLSPEASELYLDFSRRLDATPAGSEDTIFQEMAPNYDLTPAQLKEYIIALQDFMLGFIDEEPAWPEAEPDATGSHD